MTTLLSKYDKDQLTKAIGFELYASMLYKDIANKLQKIGYFGAQKHFLHESEEELEHYQRFADFCNDRLDVAQIPAIPAMSADVFSLQSAFEIALKTEKELGEFYEEFSNETDCAFVCQFLLQFLEIQRTSVGAYADILARIELCGGDKAALLMIDHEFRS